MVNETCGSCRWYRRIDGAEIEGKRGECKRLPPAPGDGSLAQWMQVLETTPECGEFKKVKHGK